jgi:NAD(P)-dependent dehydrogenase (short-subunit alcohol dehydrogenase family)
MNTFLSIGSGPGMSYATAERFAHEGFQIVFSARDAAKTGELAERLGAKGHKADARNVNCGDPKSVAALIAAVERDFGSVDVLHYNAASIRKADITEQPQETFIPDLAVNVGGALVATQAVLKRMIERRSGTVLLTGGGNAVAPTPDYLSLSIGKAGIRALTLGLFESLQEKGVHIATVTVSAVVLPDSRQSLAIGEHFWKLHAQPPGSWTAEVKFAD